MSPPEMDRRPGGETEATSATQAADLKSTSTLAEAADDVRQLARKHRRELGRRACKHLHTYRPCRSCQRERAGAQHVLGELTRAEANASAAAGTSLAEVEWRLAVTRRSA